MIPVTQTKVVVKDSKEKIVQNGNCYAAAIASMLELPISEVPNVEVFFKWAEDDSYWNDVMNMWLQFMGYKIVDAPEYKIFHYDVIDSIYDTPENRTRLKNDFYLVSGKSIRQVNHICIYKEGKLVHDPHPTRDGLLHETWFEKIVPIESDEKRSEKIIEKEHDGIL